MINAFSQIIKLTLNILKNPISIDNFTFSLWHVILAGFLIAIFVKFVRGFLQ